jgi:hypothetical protein
VAELRNRPADQADPTRTTARAAETPRRTAETPHRPADAPNRAAETRRRAPDATGRAADKPGRPVDRPRRPSDRQVRPADAPQRPGETLRRRVEAPPRQAPDPPRSAADRMRNRYGDPPRTPTPHADTTSPGDRADKGRDDGTRPDQRDRRTTQQDKGTRSADSADGIDPRWLAGIPRPPDALPDDTGRAYRLPWRRQRDNSPQTDNHPEPEPPREKDTSDRLHPHIHQPAYQDKFGDLPPPDRYGDPLKQADGTNISPFQGRPTREQTRQGELRDCGIIATFGAIAALRPDDIAKRVAQQPDGNYVVRLDESRWTNHGAEPTGNIIELTVTPDLPVHSDTPGRPAFGLPQGGAAWAPVLEKAIAGVDQTWIPQRCEQWSAAWQDMCKEDIADNRVKIPRTGPPPEGYVRLNQGSTSWERAELITQLTGEESVVRIHTSDPGDVATIFARQLRDKKPVLAASRRRADESDRLPHNLEPSHVYEVVAAKDDRIMLRNPWNHKHPEAMTSAEFTANMESDYTTLK